MSRKDSVVLGLWCAAILVLLAPVWMRPHAVFFNHGDMYVYHVPLRSVTVGAFQEGRMPFWNPYIMLGVPQAANPQAILFYPAGLLAAFFPLGSALVWDQVVHFLWAGLGVFLLARAQRLDRAGAAVLATAFALSPFLVYRVTAGIPTLLAGLSWVPWVWLAWLCGFPGLLAACFALQFLSGHAQFLIINAVGMAVWAVMHDGRRALLARLALEAGLALALAVAQWVPTAQFLRLSVRADWSGALSGAYALPPGALWTWLSPGALGTPLSGDWQDVVSVFYETCGGHVGIVALVLAIIGAARGRRRAAAFVLAAMGIFLAFGPRGTAAKSILSFAVLSYLRTPSRWLFLALWAVVLLAGAGIAVLRDRRAAAARSLVVVGGFVSLAAWDAAFLRPQDPAPFLAARPEIAEQLAGRPLRVLTDPELANLNKTALYRLRNINGYEAFYPGNIPRWAADAEGAPAADASRVYVSRWPSVELARAGVAARISATGIDEAPAWPLAAFVDTKGRRVRPDPRFVLDRPERWRVFGTVPKEAVELVLSEPPYPGWRARVGGALVSLAVRDTVFQSLSLPGSFPRGAPLELTLDFQPTGWPWLIFGMTAAWAWWLAVLARRAGAV